MFHADQVLKQLAGRREAARSRCMVAAGRSGGGVESYAQPLTALQLSLLGFYLAVSLQPGISTLFTYPKHFLSFYLFSKDLSGIYVDSFPASVSVRHAHI